MGLFDRPDDGRRGKPDVIRVGDLSEAELEELVKQRRFRRRLKAVAAIGLALAAGTFLACGARTGLIVNRAPVPQPDGGTDTGTGPVDADQHRDGMPVPDNLLE